MYIKQQISTLKRIRFLDQEDGDIDRVEDILNEIATTANNEAILDFCTVFHDSIEPYITNDMIETIFIIAERNGLQIGLRKLTEGITSMLPEARYSVNRIYKMMLNSQDLMDTYILVLKDASASKKAEVKEILNEISAKHPDLFSNKVKFVLDQVD